MHDNNVCHRDMKLENILLSQRSKTGLIKVTDFGLSKLLDGKTTVMNTYAGTPSYIAPEVLKNSDHFGNRRQSAYTLKADMWSLGNDILTALT